MATTQLNDTQGTPTNAIKYTLSMWAKRSNTFAGDSNYLASVWVDGNNHWCMRFNDDQLNIYDYISSSVTTELKTNRKFRDPAAWYHIVYVYDSANVTAGDRQKIYVNGVEETSFATDTNPGSSAASVLNVSGRVLTFGARNSASYFEGQMAHVHFCDGQSYAASDFGETDATSGIWVAKSSPSVTYGNNGFFLKFASGASGTDSSGNSNDFAVTGNLTSPKDNPDNNFCTLNPLNSNHSGALTNGNTTGTTAGDAVWRSTFSTMGAASGKWYWEGKCVAKGAYTGIGIASVENMTGSSGNSNFPALTGGYAYQEDGTKNNQSTESAYGNTYTTGDIIGVAFDATNGNMWFSKNGTWQNSATIAEIAAGTTTNAAFTGITTDTTYLPTVKFYNATTWSMNYGNGYFGTTIVSSSESDDAGIGSFEYDVPAGYYALCTTNLGDQS